MQAEKNFINISEDIFEINFTGKKNMKKMISSTTSIMINAVELAVCANKEDVLVAFSPELWMPHADSCSSQFVPLNV